MFEPLHPISRLKCVTPTSFTSPWSRTQQRYVVVHNVKTLVQMIGVGEFFQFMCIFGGTGSCLDPMILEFQDVSLEKRGCLKPARYASISLWSLLVCASNYQFWFILGFMVSKFWIWDRFVMSCMRICLIFEFRCMAFASSEAVLLFVVKVQNNLI